MYTTMIFPWELIPTIFLAFFYLMDILLLFAFGLHTYSMVYLYRKNKRACLSAENSAYPSIDLKNTTADKLPMVTIQLPIYNEYYVVERLLQAVAQIKWPRERLEIQVLDDSVDHTSQKLKQLVSHYQRKGFRFSYLHRTNREGYKAGALKAGLAKAQGEFIAIFDADFIPAREFLIKAIPYFANPKIGMVQTRWDHTNAKYSLLTRGQAIGIDGHFVLEQSGRNANQFWINFNGTAGIWRRQCILDAGNWQADTLTEDLDLSYRAELVGWKFQYILDVANPAEIPPTIAAFKSQQARWCKGSLQTALKLIRRIWRANVHWKIKLEASFRLFKYSVHPLMLMNILLSLPLLWFSHRLSLYITDLPLTAIFATAAFLTTSSLASAFFYTYAQKQIYPDWGRRILWFPSLMIIGSGISISNSFAYLEVLLKRPFSFKRTPKVGLEGSQERLEQRRKYRLSLFDPLAPLEFVFGCYCLFLAYYAAQLHHVLLSVLMVIYACGYLYLSLKGVQEAVKYR